MQMLKQKVEILAKSKIKDHQSIMKIESQNKKKFKQNSKSSCFRSRDPDLNQEINKSGNLIIFWIVFSLFIKETLY